MSRRPSGQGNFAARVLRENLGSENYGLQRQAQTNRGNQRFANFLGSLTNIPGFVGLKGIFPSTAVARDAATAYPNPFIKGEGGEYVPNTQALDEAGEYNKQYDAFLNNFLTEDHSLAPNPTNFSTDQSFGIQPKITQTYTKKAEDEHSLNIAWLYDQRKDVLFQLSAIGMG